MQIISLVAFPSLQDEKEFLQPVGGVNSDADSPLQGSSLQTFQPKFSSWSKTELWQVVDVEPMPVFGKFYNNYPIW